MKNFVKVCVVFFIVGLGAPAFSEGNPAALSEGKIGFSLGVLGGNPLAAGTAGAKYFFTDTLSFGVNFGLELDNGDEQVSRVEAGPNSTMGDWGLLLAPYLNYYFKTGHKVLPFLIGKLNLAVVDNSIRDENDAYMGMMLGFGAEFFPYDYFSVSGYAGLNMNLVEDFGLGFITSAMMANFYF